MMEYHTKDELKKSLVTSLLVCLPSFCATVYFMEAEISWENPGVVAMSVVCLGLANFASIVILEHYRSQIGRLTIPALLCAVGLVLLYVLTEGINRFYHNFGYEWLFPAVLLAVGLTLIAIFREGKIALKCQLAFNAVALSVLWSLGVADKVALPF